MGLLSKGAKLLGCLSRPIVFKFNSSLNSVKIAEASCGKGASFHKPLILRSSQFSGRPPVAILAPKGSFCLPGKMTSKIAAVLGRFIRMKLLFRKTLGRSIRVTPLIPAIHHVKKKQQVALSTVINHIEIKERDTLSVINLALFAVIPAKAGIHPARRYESDET